jgi:hypothetical protein|tara:strand:+ start:827 stop:1378 length:552 start_codon:yes stop_codon:yes gene_type:complete
VVELANSDINLLEECANSEELSIFETDTLKDLIEFKWNQYGYLFHLGGFLIHAVYVLMLFVYTDMVYINGSSKALADDGFKTNFHSLLIVLLALITYPLLYEIIQMFKGGLGEYFSDFGNYFDLIYIFGSFIMAFVHWGNPYSFASKLLMSVIVTLAIRRTFNFLRIFNALSPIVTMLNNVIW